MPAIENDKLSLQAKMRPSLDNPSNIKQYLLVIISHKRGVTITAKFLLYRAICILMCCYIVSLWQSWAIHRIKINNLFIVILFFSNANLLQ